MEILEGESIHRALLQRYARNPDGWSFTLTPSTAHGFYDAFVSRPEETWHLKLDSIYKPSPLVLGANTELPPPRPLSTFPFGFRHVNPMRAARLAKGDEGSISSLLNLLSSSRPVAPEGGKSYVQGPFVFAERGSLGLPRSPEHEKVDELLSRQLLGLMRKRYPSYG